MASKKEGRSNRKQSHYKVQEMRTARNKTNRNLKRLKNLKTKPKQALYPIGEIRPGETVFMGTVINRAKQRRRQARNLRVRNSLLASKTVLPVQESTAE